MELVICLLKRFLHRGQIEELFIALAFLFNVFPTRNIVNFHALISLF